LTNHLKRLIRKKHHIVEWQQHWTKFKGLGFSFKVLCIARTKVEMRRLEQKWIDHYVDLGWEVYNLADGGPSMEGFKHSLETRALLSTQRIGNQNALGNRHTKTFIRRFTKAVSKPHSEERKAARSKAKKEWWADPRNDWVREKIAKLNRDRVNQRKEKCP
jgi:hypothetical protein